MIPNKFVILWNEQPTGIESGYPFKTDEAAFIKYWRTHKAAQDYLNIITVNGTSTTYIQRPRIVEIQFRIVDQK